ncbi:MAG TPA: PAS domain-containing protein, partial [Anaerolineales bacterium]|nr:PAS domain-containing protein [Anaerolineales bacterium]
MVNSENEVLFANERFAEMWMIPQNIMASKDDALLLQYVFDQLSDPQDFLQRVQELYQSDEESFDALDFKDGRVFERCSRPMLQETGVRGRVWSFHEITERKQADDVVQSAEEKYRAIFYESVEGIFQSTPEGQLLTVNPALAHMWGYDSPEELI